MDRLELWQTYVRVVETGSFSAVAREMETTQPRVSKKIAALESHLGVRLLRRSTRKNHDRRGRTPLWGSAPNR